MPFTFGTVVAGSTGPMVLGKWDQQISRAKYFGVQGTSIIVGERTGRLIHCEHWLHNNWATQAQAIAAFKTCEKMIGKTRTIVDNLGQKFPNCVLLSVVPKVGPVNSPPIAWMYDLTFEWEQLTP